VAEADVEGEHVDCFTPRSRTRIVLGCACARSDTLAALGPTVRLVGWGDHRRRVYAPAMSLVEYAAADGVATLPLSNPPANCYSREMMTELDAAILAARFDPAVHVLIVRGAGERFFCAGADIAMLEGADPYFKYNFCLHANETLLRL